MTSAIAPEERISLKEDVLRSVLLGVPLPGTNTVLNFPDLPFLRQQEHFSLLDDELDEHILQAPGSEVLPVRRQLTPIAGGWLYFDEQVESDREITLTLHGAVKPDEASKLQQLSSLILHFEKRENEWRLREGPTAVSS